MRPFVFLWVHCDGHPAKGTKREARFFLCVEICHLHILARSMAIVKRFLESILGTPFFLERKELFRMLNDAVDSTYMCLHILVLVLRERHN